MSEFYFFNELVEVHFYCYRLDKVDLQVNEQFSINSFNTIFVYPLKQTTN